ncbi:hypothetical protein Rhe02_31500 [Rhizocola hellebori]|uniref:WD40 repeat domain-containing protein n=1 Tax=Rhizocola hellebori TaxID=1392758 RepID=A0A8J3VGN9_9ACTN|nr:PD40 domain-containing protein [Rhizocola hellebori]GIH05083.1 hypothetical protein Rhe02_31500 [Rhizocola hellebori]
MTDYELTTMLHELDQPEPPFPPRHLEQTLVLARAKARRHRFTQTVTSLAILTLLGVAGFVLPGQIPSGGGGAPGASIVLPEQIAGYDVLTADVAKHPAGQALMLFNSGSWETFTTAQALTLHTDGSSYRKVEAMKGPRGPVNRQALLSPDGNSVLMAEELRATNAFTLLDLTTGESRQLPLPQPAGVMLHAWSPDGKSVAFSQLPWSSDEPSNALELALRGGGVLSILDLPTGRSTTFPEVVPAAAASFGPGGDQLAVQVRDQIWVLNLPDGKRRQFGIHPPEPGLGIQPGVAWSPDGRWLALIAWRDNGTQALQPMTQEWADTYGKLTFVDATGAGRLAPDPIQAGDMLGWRTPASVLTLDQRTGQIREFSLDTGEVKALSAFEKPHTCELWTQRCGFSKVQVATELLGSMTIKPAEVPQRGPAPGWLQLVTAAATVLLGFVVFRVVRRVTSGVRAEALP